MFEVFVRNWWRLDERGVRRPHPGAPKRKLAVVSTEAEARRRAQAYNSSHDPGPLSRKAEFREL